MAYPVKAQTARIHILHLIDSLSPGGAERMAVEIANATDKSRFTVSICVTRSDLSLAATASPDVWILCLERKKTLDWTKIRQLRDFCVNERVDIIHVHGRSSFSLITFLYVLYPSMRWAGVLLHDHYGDIETDPNVSKKMRIGLRILNPVYVGVHDKLAEVAIQTGLNPNRVFTIRNAVNIQPYLREKIETPDARSTWGNRVKPYGIMVANFRPSKDIIFLLKALERIKSEPWTLAIAGGFIDDAYAKTCQELRDEQGLRDRVLFLGSRADIIDILAEADFAVLSSKTESGPLALLEYAASGLPFVSTRVGLIGNYLSEQVLPEFVPPGNIQAMAEALLRLIQLSPAERKLRGEQGREIAIRDFDIRHVLPDWYKAYETVIRPKNAGLSNDRR
jgi:glycosyltransferase involved in cell wall biosynthesis